MRHARNAQTLVTAVLMGTAILWSACGREAQQVSTPNRVSAQLDRNSVGLVLGDGVTAETVLLNPEGMSEWFTFDEIVRLEELGVVTGDTRVIIGAMSTTPPQEAAQPGRTLRGSLRTLDEPPPPPPPRPPCCDCAPNCTVSSVKCCFQPHQD